MSQHDLIIDNGSGASVRSDLNGALAALGTTMMGTGNPPSPQAGLLWIDSNGTPWILKVYDGVDWITIGTINAGPNLFTVAGIGSIVQAYDANTAKLNVVQTFTVAQRGSTSGSANISGSTTLDFAVANDFDRTLTGNVTLNNPSNVVVGQKGTIVLRQDGTGGRTLALGSSWKSAGGIAPTLSTTASAIDRLDYHVVGSSEIHVAASYDWK